MKYRRYPIQASDSRLEYKFHSEGPRGIIRKHIYYERRQDKSNVYNLAFGDVDDGIFSDVVVTNNKDTELVLATIAATVDIFFEAYSDAWIFFEGSTETRTRLYRMAISRHLEELRHKYEIFGLIGSSPQPFRNGVKYEAFLICKKSYTFI